MKIIVTGVNGQLGNDVVDLLQNLDYKDVIGIDINELDITDQSAVNDFFKLNKPDIIIHCAAYTAVDKAEDNVDMCMNVNVQGTKNLVDQARKYKSKFVYISTDYVFDGDKETPYTIEDSPSPKSIYGKSKLLGELETRKYDQHFIIRISWVFGKNGFNFVKTMLRLGNEKDEINVVNDQFGSPTYTRDLSKLIVEIINTEKYGTYHATNEGTCSWYEFAKEIFDYTKNPIIVHPINTEKYPTKAKRPKNSVLDKSSLDRNGFKRLPEWKDALKRYLKEIEVI